MSKLSSPIGVAPRANSGPTKLLPFCWMCLALLSIFSPSNPPTFILHLANSIYLSLNAELLYHTQEVFFVISLAGCWESTLCFFSTSLLTVWITAVCLPVHLPRWPVSPSPASLLSLYSSTSCRTRHMAGTQWMSEWQKIALWLAASYNLLNSLLTPPQVNSSWVFHLGREPSAFPELLSKLQFSVCVEEVVCFPTWQM